MDILKRNYKLVLLLIPIVSLLMHLHVFKLDLIGYHVWRQTQTQTVINNFYKEDFNIFHPKYNEKPDTDRIVRMEFPVMQWLFALFYKLFGNSIIISRLLSFAIGLGSVYGMFALCKGVFQNTSIATICAWAFNFSPLFYYYTLNPLPDNLALCCGIWSTVFLFLYIDSNKFKHLVFSAALLCLATLAKLPFIVYGAAAFAFFFSQLRKQSSLSIWPKLILYFLFLIPAFAWYASVMPTWGGNGVIKGILDNKLSAQGLLDILLGNIISTLPELLINYGALLFFIAGFYFLFKKKAYRNNKFPVLASLGIGVILYFLFEMNMIGTVHDYYMLPFLPPIFLVVAYGAYRLLSVNSKVLKTFSLILLLILPFTAFLRANSRWNIDSPGFNHVYYKYKEELRNIIPENDYCVAGNDGSHFILLYYLNRKGWAFDHDQLNNEQLTYYISKGARYLFIDSDIDAQPEIKKHLETKVFEKEDVRVYKLK